MREREEDNSSVLYTANFKLQNLSQTMAAPTRVDC